MREYYSVGRRNSKMPQGNLIIGQDMIMHLPMVFYYQFQVFPNKNARKRTLKTKVIQSLSSNMQTKR